MKSNFTVADDETVLAEIKHSMFPFIGYWLLAVACCGLGLLLFVLLRNMGLSMTYSLVIFILLSVGGIILAIVLILSLSSERLILTDKRVIGTKGFLARRTTEIVLEKADAVTVSNSLMGAVFKYSTVSVVTPGLHIISNGSTVGDKYSYVVNANEFSSAFSDAVEAVKANKKN
ncbi:MAG: PH domain-containing protein [Clostridia bacterium]|nr:PH domain-containing protein [Clostridia bacterium]